MLASLYVAHAAGASPKKVTSTSIFCVCVSVTLMAGRVEGYFAVLTVDDFLRADEQMDKTGRSQTVRLSVRLNSCLSSSSLCVSPVRCDRSSA